MSAMDTRCRRCGEDSWASGKVGTAGSLTFRPDEVKFLSLETATIGVRARMCTVCGSVDLIGDVAKLERLQAEAKAQP